VLADLGILEAVANVAVGASLVVRVERPGPGRCRAGVHARPVAALVHTHERTSRDRADPELQLRPMVGEVQKQDRVPQPRIVRLADQPCPADVERQREVIKHTRGHRHAQVIVDELGRKTPWWSPAGRPAERADKSGPRRRRDADRAAAGAGPSQRPPQSVLLTDQRTALDEPVDDHVDVAARRLAAVALVLAAGHRTVLAHALVGLPNLVSVGVVAERAQLLASRSDYGSVGAVLAALLVERDKGSAQLLELIEQSYPGEDQARTRAGNPAHGNQSRDPALSDRHQGRAREVADAEHDLAALEQHFELARDRLGDFRGDLRVREIVAQPLNPRQRHRLTVVLGLAGEVAEAREDPLRYGRVRHRVQDSVGASAKPAIMRVPVPVPRPQGSLPSLELIGTGEELIFVSYLGENDTSVLKIDTKTGETNAEIVTFGLFTSLAIGPAQILLGNPLDTGLNDFLHLDYALNPLPLFGRAGVMDLVAGESRVVTMTASLSGWSISAYDYQGTILWGEHNPDETFPRGIAQHEDVVYVAGSEDDLVNGHGYIRRINGLTSAALPPLWTADIGSASELRLVATDELGRVHVAGRVRIKEDVHMASGCFSPTGEVIFLDALDPAQYSDALPRDLDVEGDLVVVAYSKIDEGTEKVGMRASSVGGDTLWNYVVDGGPSAATALGPNGALYFAYEVDSKHSRICRHESL